MHMRYRTRVWRRLMPLAAVVVLWPATGWSEEVAPVRFTSLRGHVALRYFFDEQVLGTKGEAGSRETNTNFEEEVFLFTRGYFYHPGAAAFELGGGPLFVQSRFDSTGGSNSDRELLYNLVGRLRFLDRKPYPFSVYYEHLNPSLYTSIAGRILQENEKYGAEFSLQQPLLPFNVHGEAYRNRTTGEGFDRIIDDEINFASVGLNRSFATGGNANLYFQRSDVRSRSGNPALPIQPSKTVTDSIVFDARTDFGERRQYNFNILTNWMEQNSEVSGRAFDARRDITFSPDLWWRHTPRVRSTYSYRYYSAEQGQTLDTMRQTGRIGMTYYEKERWSTSGDVHAEDEQSIGVELKTYGASGSVSYSIPVRIGSLQLSYGLHYDYKSQIADPVAFEEANITLTGTVPVRLPRDFIIQSTVQVYYTDNSIGRSCTGPVKNGQALCTAGVDYNLAPVGTRIELVAVDGGAIIDVGAGFNTATVRVEYSYETRGSFDYTILDNTLQANLNIRRYVNVFVRYRNAQQDVVSGDPNIPLNSVENVTYGANANIPFWYGWLFGGDITFEHQEEDIAPFDRQNYYAYIQMPLPRFSSLRVSGTRTFIDNKVSENDVDLTRSGVHFRSRPWPRTGFTAEYTYEIDTGGLVDRTLAVGRIGFEWRFRQLLFALDGRYTDETSGDFSREKTSIRGTLRREFGR